MKVTYLLNLEMFSLQRDCQRSNLTLTAIYVRFPNDILLLGAFHICCTIISSKWEASSQKMESTGNREEQTI